MSYLIGKIWPCMLIAGLIGLILGRLLKKSCEKQYIEDDDGSLDTTTIVNKEIVSLKSDLDSTKMLVSGYDKKLKDHELKLKNAKLVIEDGEFEIQSLKSKLVGLTSAQQEVSLLKSKLNRVEYSSSDNTKELDNLKHQLVDAENVLIEAEKLRGKLTTLESKLTEKDKEIQHLKTNLSENDIKIDEIKELKDRLARSNSKQESLKSVSDELEEAKLLVSSSESEINYLKNKLSKSNDNQNISKQAIEDSQEKIDLTLQRKNEELELLKVKLRDFEKTQKRVDYLEIELKETRSSVLNSAMKLASVQNDYTTKSKEIDHRDQEIKLLQGRLVNADINLSQTSMHYDKLQSSSQHIKAVESKPTFLDRPIDSKPDNLELIKGIGNKLHGVLNELGVYHFHQIASWNEKEVAWVNNHLAFSGRIQREEWIKQAKDLMDGKETEFSKRVEKGEVATSNKTKEKKKKDNKYIKHSKRLRKK